MQNPSTITFPSNLCIQFLLLITTLHITQCLPDPKAIRSDLANLNLICRGRDSCRDNRTSDSLIDYNCHCGSYCRDLDTCCLDSSHRNTWRQTAASNQIKCLGVNGLQIYMVDECRRGWRDDDDGFVRGMCSSDGKDRDDPFLAVPVMSLRTGLTYKNYYCAVCNENPRDDQVVFFNVAVRSKTEKLSNPTDRDIKYDSAQNSWTMESDDGNATPVILDMKVPESIQQKVITCRSSGHVSKCSPEWTDRSMAEKCLAYTALVSTNTNGKFVRYKNPHCAICNFEQTYAIDCEDSVKAGFGFTIDRKTFFVGLFVLDDEEKKKKCNRGMVYDALAKKCRTVRCPRNHILRNRKCVPNRP